MMHIGVHALMILKCLRMRHTYDNDMQTNICNTFCMLSIAWRCNDVVLTMFHLGGAAADSLYGFAIPVNLLKLVSMQ